MNELMLGTLSVKDWALGLLSGLGSWIVNTGLKIVLAVILLIVLFKVIDWLGKKLNKLFEKKAVDKTLSKTLIYIIKLAGKTIVVVCLVGFLGFDTSALTALIASLGVCLGLAVNGAVANIAGGVLIIITRPFKVDDFIEAQGVMGTVTDIHLTNTKVLTVDNRVVHVPNGALANGNIINYSEKDQRRVDLVFTVSYASDVEKAKALVMGVLDSHELVLKDPEPFVRLSAHGKSAIEITSRAWVSTADYWTVYFDILENVKTEFDKAGIDIPFDQLDVHVKND